MFGLHLFLVCVWHLEEESLNKLINKTIRERINCKQLRFFSPSPTEKGFCGTHYPLGRMISMQPCCYPPLLQVLSVYMTKYLLPKKTCIVGQWSLNILILALDYPPTSFSNHNCCWTWSISVVFLNAAVENPLALEYRSLIWLFC